MKERLILILTWLTAATAPVLAQQQVMFTQYMHNEAMINPAYAGSQETGSATVLYRNQWMGMEGAPVTYSFNIHAPVQNRKMGIGLSVLKDQTGITDNFNLYGLYAYSIPVNAHSHVQLGLQAGLDNFNIDLGRLRPKNPGDDNFTDGTFSSFRLNFGTGAYYFTEKFYAGISLPKLMNHKVLYNEETSLKQSRHLFITSGYVFDLSDDIKLKPSVLYKYAEAAPMQLDVTTQFIFKEILWTGLAWRSFDSVDLLLGLQAGKQLHIGYAYDFATTPLGDYHTGSHEILLNYRLRFSSKRVLTPRFF